MQEMSTHYLRRVLVAAGVADEAETLRSLLTVWGCEVTVTSDGPAAVRAAEQSRLDAALVDLGLDGLDGYEVARRIQGGPAGVPVLVALSARNGTATRTRAQAAGFNRLLVWPFDPEELRHIIAAVPDRS